MISGMSDPSPRQDSRHTIARNARYGLWLFFVYVIFYAGFVAISAFKFDALRADVGGVNLAVAYGMGLILLAFLLALVYMTMTRNDSTRDSGDARDSRDSRPEGRA
ncbi:MAG: hypothetical protein QOE14_2312 [Humisphaera sp.]|nr:hypothetical protein [Humisphaera sp.]